VKKRLLGIGALIVLSVSTIGIEFSRRQALYWYDVRADHAIQFSGPRVSRVPVDVSEQGFTFPDTDFSGDTVLLALEVSSTLSGLWFEPYVTIGRGDMTTRQYLERGAHGRRYFLLSSDGLEPGLRLDLAGSHIGWREQTAELLLFRNPSLAEKKILVLAPHPDDAEIAAFGFYSGRRSYVATVTAGNYLNESYAHVYRSAAERRELLGELRTWDSLAVPMLGGVPPERSVNLGYSNSSLRRLYEQRDDETPLSPDAHESLARFRRDTGSLVATQSTVTPTWASLVNDISALLDTIAPDVVVAPHPALDAAPDHQLTGLALVEALERRASEASALYLYTNHHVLTEYYPFGPSDSVMTTPPWLDGRVSFASLYSHGLSAEKQAQKLFALDAMHDLRQAPNRFVGGPAKRFLDRLRWAGQQIKADPLGTYSYFRRAVRPNEIFFVYGAEELPLLTGSMHCPLVTSACE
jgi:LmbE family N-acetylglucosaminyl deacetylase